MKRKPESKTGARLGDILEATSKDQRAWIGAVTLAYNDAEDILHRVAGACMNFPGNSYSVTSRINGTEGIINIIYDALASIPLPTGSITIFEKTLSEEGFPYLKGLRDAVIHSRLFDTHTSIAVAPGGRGKTQDVLLSVGALEGLYRRMAILKDELDELETLILAARKLTSLPAPDDQQKARLERDIQRASAQCQGYQHARRSLPLFPKFPAQPAVHELVPQWVVPKQ